MKATLRYGSFVVLGAFAVIAPLWWHSKHRREVEAP